MASPDASEARNEAREIPWFPCWALPAVSLKAPAKEVADGAAEGDADEDIL